MSNNEISVYSIFISFTNPLGKRDDISNEIASNHTEHSQKIIDLEILWIPKNQSKRTAFFKLMVHLAKD